MPMERSGRFDQAVEKAALGDEVAIGALFTELQPRLLRFLRSQEPRAADDIAADVWLGVARSIASFEGDWDDFRAWFFSIARRRLADHRRTAARRPAESIEATVLELYPATDSTEDRALSELSGTEATTLITTVLNGDQAQVLLLRVLGDLDAEQVAAIMERSPNWVRVTQHRALRKLARRLGREVLVTR